jgi:hypothetical protein
MSRTLYAALAATTILVGTANANDSTAALGAGGLTLTRTEDVRMASEDLFISKEDIRVNYSFVNESGHPITTRVAFPLPDLDMGEMGDVDLNWPTDNPSNALNFVIKIDGREVHPSLEKRASFKGQDITDLLTRLGAPLGYPQKGFEEALKALSPAAKKELSSRGMADFTGDYPHAMWVARETFHWEQTFPSDRPLKVEHTYKPVVGGSFLASNEFPQAYMSSGFFKNFCIDKTTEAGIKQRLKQAKWRAGPTGLLLAWYVDYVLTTGANWKGPIGQFRLTIDKGKPDNIVSFCMDGVRKVGATRFVVEKRDFEPTKDLHNIIVENMPPEAN